MGHDQMEEDEDEEEEIEKVEARSDSPTETEGKVRRLDCPAVVEEGFAAEVEVEVKAKAQEMVGEGMPSERDRESVEQRLCVKIFLSRKGGWVFYVTP